MCDILNYSFDEAAEQHLANDINQINPETSQSNPENNIFNLNVDSLSQHCQEGANIFDHDDNTHSYTTLPPHFQNVTCTVPNNSDDEDCNVEECGKEIMDRINQFPLPAELMLARPELQVNPTEDGIGANSGLGIDSIKFFQEEFSSDDEERNDDDDSASEEEEEGEGEETFKKGIEAQEEKPKPSDVEDETPEEGKTETSLPCNWGANNESLTQKLVEKDTVDIPCTCSHLLHATSDQIQGWSGSDNTINHRSRFHRKHKPESNGGVSKRTHHRQTQHWSHHNAFPRREGGGGGGGRWASSHGNSSNAASGASELHHSNSLMAGDHKAFMSAESEFVPFVFRHYSDTKKYMEQYRKMHTKGDIYQRAVRLVRGMCACVRTWHAWHACLNIFF